MNNWFNRPVFVTGCTGLLGPWVCQRLLSNGANVIGLVRDSVPKSNLFRLGLDRQMTLVRGDVTDLPLLERVLNEYEVDTIFHLAAQAIVGAANRSPISTLETNIRGTWSLLEAARHSPWIRRVVVASSDKAYGDHDNLPYVEDTPLKPKNFYDVSKASADLLAQAYHSTFGLPVAIARAGNLYGGGDLNFNRIIPGTVEAALRGRAPVIRSDGTYLRDYFYVEDAAAAYLALAEHIDGPNSVAGQAFNFSNDDPRTVLEIAQRVLLLAGREDLQPAIQGTATSEIVRQYLSSAKARTRLQWAPEFSLDAGLTRTIDWYKEFFAAGDAGRQ